MDNVFGTGRLDDMTRLTVERDMNTGRWFARVMGPAICHEFIESGDGGGADLSGTTSEEHWHHDREAQGLHFAATMAAFADWHMGEPELDALIAALGVVRRMRQRTRYRAARGNLR